MRNQHDTKVQSQGLIGLRHASHTWINHGQKLFENVRTTTILVLDCLWTMKQNTDFEVDSMDGLMDWIDCWTDCLRWLASWKSYSTTCTVRVPALVAVQCSEAFSDLNAWGFWFILVRFSCRLDCNVVNERRWTACAGTSLYLWIW